VVLQTGSSVAASALAFALTSVVAAFDMMAQVVQFQMD
jgi:hypothetical protein